MLGYHLISRLRALGCEVRTLVRDPGAASWLADEGATLVAGDVRNSDSLLSAAAQVDVIFHCAALIKAAGGWDSYCQTNVDGTANVVAAARENGARVVHASSVAVYGSFARHRSDGLPTTEDTPFAELETHEYYARSKRAAEEVVLDSHKRGEVWACALRPDVMYGAHDRQFTPRAGRIMLGPLVPVVGAGKTLLPIVYAGNVADAMILAATRDAAGGRVFNVANDFDITYLNFVRLAAQGLGRKPRIVHVPVSVARVVARSLELLARTPLAAGFPIPANNSIDFVTRDNPFSSERARRELGWNPQQRPEQSVPASFRWWMEQGE